MPALTANARVKVLDQDAAAAFLTERLGFDPRSYGPLDGVHWLTVSPPRQNNQMPESTEATARSWL